MNIIDIIIILLIIMFAVIGGKKGFVKTLVSLVGIILVFIISYFLKNSIAEFLSLNLPFFNFVGSFKGATILNVIIYQLIAFIIVFSILMVLYAIVVKVSGILDKILKSTIILAIPSKVGGVIVGIIEGVVISLIALIFLSLPVLNFTMVESSGVKKFLFNISPIIGNISNNTNDAVSEIFELKDKFSESDNKEEFNLSCLDVLLKHKVIRVDYSEKLVDSTKLKIDRDKAKAIINKYK